MIRRLLATLILSALAMLVQAGETSRILADTMVLKELEGVTEFIGHVQYSQPDQHIAIQADRLTIHSEDNKVVQVQAVGEPVRFSHGSSDRPIRGEARQLDYFAASDSITLTGDARVQAGKDLIRGERIEYNIASQQAVASGGADSGGRFEAVITPGAGNTGNSQTE